MSLKPKGKELPWYKHHPTMFSTITNHLSHEELGILVRLQGQYWLRNRHLPASSQALVRLLGGANEDAVRNVLEEFFQVDGDALICPSMEILWAEATGDEIRRKAQTAAATAASVAARRERDNVTLTMPERDVDVTPDVSERPANVSRGEEDTETDTEGELEGDRELDEQPDSREALRQAEENWSKAPSRTPEEKERKAAFRREFFRLRAESKAVQETPVA